jgi:hypothetical protein
LLEEFKYDVMALLAVKYSGGSPTAEAEAERRRSVRMVTMPL